MRIGEFEQRLPCEKLADDKRPFGVLFRNDVVVGYGDDGDPAVGRHLQTLTDCSRSYNHQGIAVQFVFVQIHADAHRACQTQFDDRKLNLEWIRSREKGQHRRVGRQIMWPVPVVGIVGEDDFVVKDAGPLIELNGCYVEGIEDL